MPERVLRNRDANKMPTVKSFAAMTFCHGPLQYTTHILSYQSKSNELREAREVFFQWLSGHSQTGKCLVDLYGTGFTIARDWLSRSLFGHLILRYQDLYRPRYPLA